MATLARVRLEVAKFLTLPAGSQRPLPVERLARDRGFHVVFQPLDSGDNMSGFYFRGGDRRVIGVNSTHPRVRQRFTIAHELGHGTLHDQEGLHLDQAFMLRDQRSGQASDPKEIDANTFAAELLMPADEVFSSVAEARIDVDDEEGIARLARHFGVSRQALMYRMANLGLQIDGTTSV